LSASIIGIVGSSVSIVGSSALAGLLLGANMLPVLSLALPFYYLFATVGAMIGVGGAHVCARLIGWQRHEECQRAFSLVYVLAVLMGLVLTVILLFLMDPLLALMGTPPELLEPARAYLTVLLPGGVFIIGIYPAFNMLRLDGQTTKAACLFLGMGALTIMFNLLFLAGFGWGIQSVAVALCLSYGLVSVTGALLLLRQSLNFRFVSPFDRGMHVALRLTRSLLDAGSPNALENICIVIRSAVVNNLAAVSFGAVALGAYVLIDNVTVLALIFAASISGAAMAFLGVFFAEKDAQGTAKILRLSFLWGVPTIITLALILELFAPHLVRMFGASTVDDIQVFSTAIRVFAAGLPFLLFNYLMITVYQSQKRMGASRLIVLLRELACPLALMGLLTLPLGMVGIWAAFPLAEVLTTFLILVYSVVCRMHKRSLSAVFLIDRQAEQDDKSVSLVVRNDVVHITEAIAQVEAFCERKNLGARLAMGIQLALEEMLLVIGEKSLSGAPNRTMSVRVLVPGEGEGEGEEVIVRIRNGGLRFNPIEYAERLSKTPREVKLLDEYGAGGQVAVFGHDERTAADALPEHDERVAAGTLPGHDERMAANALPEHEVPLELTGILMILKRAEVVDYRSTFGANNLMMILKG
jgi:Na+-driven multidrug efflux pump